MRTVFVTSQPGRFEIQRMFQTQGSDFVVEKDDPLKADIIVWTGGADVHPSLYGQELHPRTNSVQLRDREDKSLYDNIVDEGKLLVGICRGGQFLNVMNGGKLWQHVTNHAVGRHKAIDLRSGEEISVTSTHHQMIRATDGGEVLCIAHEADNFQDDKTNITIKDVKNREENEPEYDTEVVWYPETRSLCFQPHPEYDSKGCRNYFFSLVNELL